MWLVVNLTLAALFLLLANRYRPAPISQEYIDELTLQAQIQYELVASRIKETIEEDNIAIRSPRSRSILTDVADIRAHREDMKAYLQWMEQVKKAYAVLAEANAGNMNRQLQLVKDWRAFIDTVWAQSNIVRWQEIYMEHGLGIEDELYESAKLHNLKAEEIANRFFGQIKPA